MDVTAAARSISSFFVLLIYKISHLTLPLQLVFKKRLSLKKWGGLILLLIGCILGKIGGGTLPGITEVTLVAWGLLVLQAVCSSFGSVYFQWILQHGPKSAKGTGIWEKNIYLYLAGSVLNGLFTVGTGHPSFTYLPTPTPSHAGSVAKKEPS